METAFGLAKRRMSMSESSYRNWLQAKMRRGMGSSGSWQANRECRPEHCLCGAEEILWQSELASSTRTISAGYEANRGKCSLLFILVSYLISYENSASHRWFHSTAELREKRLIMLMMVSDTESISHGCISAQSDISFLQRRLLAPGTEFAQFFLRFPLVRHRQLLP